jgi:mono/diheme cytochrome c family protein
MAVGPSTLGALALGLALLCAAAGRVAAQHPPGHAPSPAPPTPSAGPPAVATPRRVSEDELHRYGTPRGWKFTVPPGDPQRGREVFRQLECYKCHEIKAEKFPAPSDGKYSGPELTGMGSVHPSEYIAESILFPNAVIVDEPGTTGPDGLSLMPSYADSLTLAQWVDLVAYLKGLTEGGKHPMRHAVERVATAGAYRIRLVYAEGHGDHMAHHGAPAGGMARPHLMAFITDRESGEAVPYLPVTATVQAPGTARRTITLRPMMGDDGFHYGADVALPKRATKLTLAVGPTSARVSASAKGRFSTPTTAVFDWTTPDK